MSVAIVPCEVAADDFDNALMKGVIRGGTAMSAGRQQTAEELAYYNSPAFRAREEKAKAEAAGKLKYTTTARWMRGESIEEFKESAKALKPATPHKEYLDSATVEKATIRRMEIDRQKEYDALVSHLPEPIAKQFKIGSDIPKTIPGMPHLASTILGRMLHVAQDGSRSVVHVCRANFTPKGIDPNGHRFEEIPAQYDGVKNRAVTYLVGQRINPDGSLGEMDRKFLTPDGKAMMTHSLGDVQAALMKIGTANLAIMKQQRQKSETAQFGSQAQRDAFRAYQSQLRAQEDGRNYGREQQQDAGRSFGR
ncbi:hypothetical protein V6R85_24150 [Agrobacterium sp. CCNWLW32]|uniref:hypothetical protein n=1 Tax=Agrobacterium sp. CCNWLW32 TaxID=3122072 RepID=UPI0030100E90